MDFSEGFRLKASFTCKKIHLLQQVCRLIDISEKMIEVAKYRFKDKNNITYIIGDYSKCGFDKKFDIVVSSLSIHHLTDDQKKQLYENIYIILNPGGVFINADQVLGSTPFIETVYKRAWKLTVENSGLSRDEISSAYERTALDRMGTLDDQLKWLKDIGFIDVDCIYKYYNFVVMFGRK